MVSILRRYFTPQMFKYCLNTLVKENVAPKALFCSRPEPKRRLLDPETVVRTLADGDPEIENKLRVLMLEVEVMRQDGRRAPPDDFMQMRYWEYLLTLKSQSGRVKYLSYLWKNSIASQNRKAKQAEKNRLYEERKLRAENAFESLSEMTYSLGKNSMLVRINDITTNAFYNFKAHQATLFGRKIVIDCSYGKYMSHAEEVNTANQLTDAFAINRTHREPADMRLCNVDRSSVTMKQLQRNIPNVFERNFPMFMHTESYLDMYPKEKLVYLTPHCNFDLVYDPDDVYIIGAMVDKKTGQPISLAKAKEYNLRMARLPLDRYLNWIAGSGKSLTINQVVAILADLNPSQNWSYALRHVPRRKLMPMQTNRHRQFYDDPDDLKTYISNKGRRNEKRSINVDDFFV